MTLIRSTARLAHQLGSSQLSRRRGGSGPHHLGSLCGSVVRRVKEASAVWTGSQRSGARHLEQQGTRNGDLAVAADSGLRGSCDAELSFIPAMIMVHEHRDGERFAELGKLQVVACVRLRRVGQPLESLEGKEGFHERVLKNGHAALSTRIMPSKSGVIIKHLVPVVYDI